MNRGMVSGSIIKSILLFAIPLVLSGLLQQMYNIADGVIVGNFVGEGELAAIGATSVLSLFFTNFIIGLTRGVNVLISQLYGAEDTQNISRASGTFSFVITCFSVLLLLIALPLIQPILALLNTPIDIMADAVDYIGIILLGIPFVAVYNVCAAMLRGIGNSKTPFFAIIVAALTNVALDLVFVIVFQWGIQGAAAATLISQIMSALFMIGVIQKRYPILHFPRKRFFSKAIFLQGFRLGLPMAVQSGIMSFGSMLLQNVMNSFGTLVITGITTAYRIDSLIMLPIVNLSTAVSTFTGQNMGAKAYGRVKKGFGQSILIMLFTSVCVTTTIIIFGQVFLGPFGISQEARDIGMAFFLACALFYPVFGLQNAFIGFLYGIGDVIFPTVMNISGLCLRLFLSYTLAERVGVPIIAYAEIAGWLWVAAMCMLRCIYQFKRKQSKFNINQDFV